MTEPRLVGRCAAAHPDDPTACEGAGNVVRIVDKHGTSVLGCVHHAARLYASLIRPHVYPTEGNGWAAIDVFQHAQTLPPFCWVPGRGGEER